MKAKVINLQYIFMLTVTVCMAAAAKTITKTESHWYINGVEVVNHKVEENEGSKIISKPKIKKKKGGGIQFKMEPDGPAFKIGSGGININMGPGGPKIKMGSEGIINIGQGELFRNLMDSFHSSVKRVDNANEQEPIVINASDFLTGTENIALIFGLGMGAIGLLIGMVVLFTVLPLGLLAGALGLTVGLAALFGVGILGGLGTAVSSMGVLMEEGVTRIGDTFPYETIIKFLEELIKGINIQVPSELN